MDEWKDTLRGQFPLRSDLSDMLVTGRSGNICITAPVILRKNSRMMKRSPRLQLQFRAGLIISFFCCIKFNL